MKLMIVFYAFALSCSLGSLIGFFTLSPDMWSINKVFFGLSTFVTLVTAQMTEREVL
jgi:hypothetical protein